MSNPRPRFMWRAMTSILIAASFLLLLISGAVLFVSPPGRVANWGNWHMIGLTKHDWTGVHTWFAAVFVLTAEQTLREIALGNGYDRPYEIIDILQVTKP